MGYLEPEKEGKEEKKNSHGSQESIISFYVS